MVPFLNYTPDARSGALGASGVALFMPDANSVAWNMSNLVSAEKRTGVSLNYTPWLRGLVPDAFFSFFSAYIQVNRHSVLGFALRYYNPGDFYKYTLVQGTTPENKQFRELSSECGYGVRLNPKFSAGLNLRYIYSDIFGMAVINGVSTKPGQTLAGDVNITYQSHFDILGKTNRFKLGLNIQNLGGKITYLTNAERDFIPTNLKIGVGMMRDLNKFGTISGYFDLNKLMVSALQSSFVIADVNQGWVPSIGAEYWFRNMISARLGGSFDGRIDDGLPYVSCGFGGRIKKIAMHFAGNFPVLKEYGSTWQYSFSLLCEFGSHRRNK